mgnify:FL=1
MSYKKNREVFFTMFAREFPSAMHSDALALLRAGTAEQRWNEVQCSIEIGEQETARQEMLSERRMMRVSQICARFGAVLVTNGDPRGYPDSRTEP